MRKNNINEARAHVDELLFEASYAAVQNSELWTALENPEIDQKARELAAKIRSVTDDWLIEQESLEELKRQREQEQREEEALV